MTLWRIWDYMMYGLLAIAASEIVLFGMLALTVPPPAVKVRPQTGFEPLQVQVEVRLPDDARGVYVAIVEQGNTIMSSARQVIPERQPRETFLFRDVMACECEVVVLIESMNDVRVHGRKPLTILGRGNVNLD